MDTSKKHQKNHSSNTYSEGLKALFLIITLAIGFGCSTTNKDLNYTVSNLKSGKELELIQLTVTGSNYHPSWHPSGNKVLYVGESKPTHKSGQIYELDLEIKKERRITFNAGNDSYPKYHPSQDLLIYSSSTDELKEALPLEQLKVSLGISERTPQSELLQHQPIEIYLSSLYGSKIRRITNRSGFDGDAVFSPDGKGIIYSTVVNNQHQVEIFNLENNVSHKMSLLMSNLRWPTIYSKEKIRKLAGISESPEKSKLVVQTFSPTKSIDFESSENAIYLQPQWHPTEQKLVFSSNRISKNNFDLFVLNLQSNCMQQITYSSALDQDPAFSPDGTKILFSSNRSGQNQVYFIKYDADQPCEKSGGSI